MKRTLALAALLAFGAAVHAEDKPASPASPAPIQKIKKTDEEWKKELTADQYSILRDKGTERPGTSPLVDDKTEGTYLCAGCGLPLFESNTKFHSGTGWPSFFDVAAKPNVQVNRDESHGMIREEVVCARCDGHLGHVFPDGPEPTGKRYCINGLSIKLAPKEGNK